MFITWFALALCAIAVLLVVIRVAKQEIDKWERESSSEQKFMQWKEEDEERRRQRDEKDTDEVNRKLNETKTQGSYPAAFLDYLADNFLRLNDGKIGYEGELFRKWLIRLAVDNADTSCLQALDKLSVKIYQAKLKAVTELRIVGGDRVAYSNVLITLKPEVYDKLLEQVDAKLFELRDDKS